MCIRDSLPGQLTAPGSPARHRTGPQEPGPVPTMPRLGAGTVRFAASAVVLADRAPAEVPGHRQLLIEPLASCFQVWHREFGHAISSVWLLIPQPDSHVTSTNPSHLHSCRTPGSRHGAGCRPDRFARGG